MTTAEVSAGAVGLTSVLQSAQSPDAALRGQAEQHLQQLRENNHAQFVASLTEELCEESKPIDTRRLAGLILKNELDARDEARKVSFCFSSSCFCFKGPGSSSKELRQRPPTTKGNEGRRNRASFDEEMFVSPKSHLA